MSTPGTITLNGERREWPHTRTVEHLLQDLALDSRVVAVELNRLVVKRGRYVDTPVQDGDEVEIVSFVGGG
jgi:thiamine biosynthesis protein ThiS